jgi:hypothetical protein
MRWRLYPLTLGNGWLSCQIMLMKSVFKNKRYYNKLESSTGLRSNGVLVVTMKVT